MDSVKNETPFLKYVVGASTLSKIILPLPSQTPRLYDIPKSLLHFILWQTGLVIPS